MGHTRLSFRVMSVRRAGLRVTGDKREEVERRAGRNNALPERNDMMEVWMLDLPSASYDIRLTEYAVCRHGSVALQYPPLSCTVK
jgi:hypothetical protein